MEERGRVEEEKLDYMHICLIVSLSADIHWVPHLAELQTGRGQGTCRTSTSPPRARVWSGRLHQLVQVKTAQKEALKEASGLYSGLLNLTFPGVRWTKMSDVGQVQVRQEWRVPL